MFDKKWLNLILAIIMLFTAVVFNASCVPKTFTVTFEGGAEDAVFQSGLQEQIVTDSSQIVPPVYTRPGYNFVGWDRSISMIEDSTIVKAQWREYEFEVRFQSNGGKTEDDEDLVVVTVNSAVELNEKQPKFIKEGYDLSWDKDLNAITLSCTVNAVWTPKQYNLEFFDKDGVAFNNNKMQVTYNEKLEEISVIAPAVSGKRFAYWTKGNSSDAPSIDKGIVWCEDSGASLYPNYVDKDAFIITYDLDGGKIGKRTYSYDANMDENANVLFDAEREGYNFEGWLINDSQTPKLSNKITIKDFKKNGEYADVTLKASWGNRPYMISFDTQGGTLTGQATKQIKFNDTVGELPTAKRQGCVFIGWYYDGKMITENDLWEYPNDATLTAKYLLEYNVKFSLSTVISTDEKVITCRLSFSQEDFEETTFTLLEGQSLYTAFGFSKMPVVVPIEQAGQTEYEFGGYWKWIDGAGNEHIVESTTVFSLELFEGVQGGETITLVPHCRAIWSPNA